MKIASKALIGTLAAGAVALASAGPAEARDRHRDRDGIDAGDVLAGALIIGGIAAVAAAASDNDDRYDRRHDRYDQRYDRRYDDRWNDRRYEGRHDDRRYDRRGNREQAVRMCVRAAERYAERYTRSRAEVYDIRDVDRERRGFEVKGRIAVQDRGWGDRRGNWDEGRFKCEVRRGRVVDIDYSGIRGL